MLLLSSEVKLAPSFVTVGLLTIWRNREWSLWTLFSAPNAHPTPFEKEPYKSFGRKSFNRWSNNRLVYLRTLWCHYGLNQPILFSKKRAHWSYYYFGHNHALVFYSQKLDAIMQHTIPSDLDPHRTFGVPFRDLDKCEQESECLLFDQYMKMTRQTFTYKERRTDLPQATIIGTSEPVQAMAQYQNEGRPKRIFGTLCVHYSWELETQKG